MPLEMQTVPIVPNAIYFPQILIQTGIQNGVLKSTAQIIVAAAKVDADQIWQRASQTNTIHISDIDNLDADIAHLQPQVTQLYAALVGMVDSINIVRKVL